VTGRPLFPWFYLAVWGPFALLLTLGRDRFDDDTARLRHKTAESRDEVSPERGDLSGFRDET
jgi:hypothetical protein